MQINYDSLKYIRYKASKKLYLSFYKDFFLFRKEFYCNKFSQRLIDKCYGKIGFKKILRAIKYFLKKKRAAYLQYNKARSHHVLCCIIKVISTSPRPIIEIELFSQFYFNSEFYFDKEYYNFLNNLYCKSLQDVVFQFMKGVIMPEYFIDTSEDLQRLDESGENYGDVWEEIINARTEKLKQEGKWDDAPGNRVYIEKWYKVPFFMPYARKKSKRLKTVIREVGPIYPEGAIKLEDYYRDHKDSRPKLSF